MLSISRIDISNSEAILLATNVRKFVYFVLLLAVKDGATEVRIEPSESEGVWKLRYQVGSVWDELEPIPLHIPIAQEVRRLARMYYGFRWWRRLTGLANQPATKEGGIRLIISGAEIDVIVSIHSRGFEAPESVVLRLPGPELPSEGAWRILREYLVEWDRRRKQTGEQPDAT